MPRAPAIKRPRPAEFVERVQVEEGFLDGLDLTLSPGLNVLIGARGTGKTSVIELIRFCLDVPGYGAETDKRSRLHALSVLGSGQVTVTVSNGQTRTVISRTASDASPRASGAYSQPLIFSQTEIESVGLHATGRLQLLSSFAPTELVASEEAAVVATARSLTTEAEATRRELEEYKRQIEELPRIEEELLSLRSAEMQLAKVSAESASKKKALDTVAGTLTSLSVAATAVERFAARIGRWKAAVHTAVQQPVIETWPAAAGDDPLSHARNRMLEARQHLLRAVAEAEMAEAEVTAIARKLTDRRVVADERSRQLRKEIEVMQSGAGNVSRRAQLLREKKAQLESLTEIVLERDAVLSDLITQRNAALDRVDAIRETRFRHLRDAADSANVTLGPRIKVSVTRAGQFEKFAAAIADTLRGSGLRYNDLARTLAQVISPRELVEAAESGDAILVSEATGVSYERVARVLSQLREADLGSIATVAVDDVVQLSLLDGSDYKDISELSTGQRCTVVLPLVLRHAERALIVDQPEDHIDNAFIVDTLIRSLVARATASQVIFSTHNANIPVLGGAQRVIQMGSDGKRAFVSAAGDLETPAVVSAITTVMEGGAEAFERRAAFYGRHKKRDSR